MVRSLNIWTLPPHAIAGGRSRGRRGSGRSPRRGCRVRGDAGSDRAAAAAGHQPVDEEQDDRPMIAVSQVEMSKNSSIGLASKNTPARNPPRRAPTTPMIAVTMNPPGSSPEQQSFRDRARKQAENDESDDSQRVLLLICPRDASAPRACLQRVKFRLVSADDADNQEHSDRRHCGPQDQRHIRDSTRCLPPRRLLP